MSGCYRKDGRGAYLYKVLREPQFEDGGHGETRRCEGMGRHCGGAWWGSVRGGQCCCCHLLGKPLISRSIDDA